MKKSIDVKLVLLLVLSLLLAGCPSYLVTIISPSDGANFEIGEEITFSGFAKDIMNGELSGDSLVWSSDQEGEIAKGKEFKKDDLLEGVHVITLTATNAKGESTTDAITITISKGNPPTTSTTIAPDDRLESNCFNWPEEEFSPTNRADLTTSLDKGEQVVDFILKDTGGNSYTLTSLLATKPVLLVFGAFT